MREDVEIYGPEEVPAWKPKMCERARSEFIEKGNPLPILARSKDLEDFTEKVGDLTISSGLREELGLPCVQFSLPGERITNARAIGKVLMQKALAGDLNAIREVLNRTEGKVPNVTRSTSANVSVRGDANSIASLMQRIDQNKG